LRFHFDGLVQKGFLVLPWFLPVSARGFGTGSFFPLSASFCAGFIFLPFTGPQEFAPHLRRVRICVYVTLSSSLSTGICFPFVPPGDPVFPVFITFS